MTSWFGNMHQDPGDEIKGVEALVGSGSVVRVVVASSHRIVKLPGLLVPAEPFETHWRTHQITREALEGLCILGVDSDGVGPVGSTLENLRAAAAGENHEWTSMYPEFARIAREEGFEAIPGSFEAIAVAEKQHEKRYLDLAGNVAEGTAFKKTDKVVWRCHNCGYLHEGPEAPATCPACAHSQAHFKLLGENW